MGTTYSEKYTVTYERKKHVSGGKRKSNGGHQKAIGSGGSRKKGWHKEIYGKCISKDDYYEILETYDSYIAKGTCVDFAINWTAYDCSVSEAKVIAIVKDR